MNLWETASLGAYFVLMMAIGVYAYRKSTDDVSGYMLGGRQLHPAVASLSAGASDMSGWMLLGLPGALYVGGLVEAWIAVGLTIGALVNYIVVAPRLRVFTEIADDAITIPDYFEKRFHDTSRTLRVLSSLVIVVFFTIYTSSGVVAGGKLFDSAFGLDYRIGLFLTAGVVIAYTLFGGFLAVSLTDFVQGCIMFVALIVVPIVAIAAAGGPTTVIDTLATHQDGFLDMTTKMTADDTLKTMGVFGFISLLSWGLGYFGQPHIIVRFMAIRSLKDVKTARNIGMAWMTVTVIGAVLTGLAGLAYVLSTSASLSGDDPETIFIFLSQTLFHPAVSGFLLAAILAAIMSTISSQLLVASSSLTEDFYKTFLKKDASQTELVMVGRAAVFAVALIAIFLAFDPSSNILTLVSNAWAGFGAAFGPLVVFSLYWKGMTRNAAIAGMLVGAVSVLGWIYLPVGPGGAPVRAVIYEMAPGVMLSTLAIVEVSLLERDPKGRVARRFDHMTEVVEGNAEPERM